MGKKKFSLVTVVLSVICVVFVTEAAAPVASIGNSQFFWWVFMIVLFLVPYGLVSSELGTAYPGEGGLYDWVSRAYPSTRWGGRIALWYWLNFPLWAASLAVLVPQLLSFAFGWHLSVWMALIIELVFIWIVILVSLCPISESITVLNASAVVKVFLALLVGVMGLWFGFRSGFANPTEFRTFLPSFDLDSLRFISVIIFNMMGFEIVCTYAADMDDPKRQIPAGIVAGGLAIAAIYLLSGFGICASIPVADIDTGTSLVDAFVAMGVGNQVFLAAVALLFIVTLFGSLISWASGVSSMTAYAADKKDAFKLFKRRWSRNGAPIGVELANGIITSVLVIVGAILSVVAPESDLFWTFFSLTLVLFLLCYVPLFPAFLKLRRTDSNALRPFRVPGGPVFLRIFAICPMVLVAVSVFFTAAPLSVDALAETLPTTVGLVLLLVLTEVILIFRQRHRR